MLYINVTGHCSSICVHVVLSLNLAAQKYFTNSNENFTVFPLPSSIKVVNMPWISASKTLQACASKISKMVDFFRKKKTCCSD